MRTIINKLKQLLGFAKRDLVCLPCSYYGDDEHSPVVEMKVKKDLGWIQKYVKQNLN